MPRYKIDESPYCEKVESLLMSGSSIRQVAEYLKRQNGFSVSPASVQSFKKRRRISSAERPSPESSVDEESSSGLISPLEQLLSGIDREGNEADYLKKLLLVQLLRIDRTVLSSEIDDKREQAIDRQVETARKLTVDLVKVKMDLGLVRGDNSREGGYTNPYEKAAALGRPSLGEALGLVNAGLQQQIIRAVEEALLGMSCPDGI